MRKQWTKDLSQDQMKWEVWKDQAVPIQSREMDCLKKTVPLVSDVETKTWRWQHWEPGSDEASPTLHFAVTGCRQALGLLF